MTRFVIVDESHAEHQGEFIELLDAVAELRRRAKIPWDQEPNQAPCQSWAACGRTYVVIEFDDTQELGKELRRTGALDISKEGVVWHEPFRPANA